MLSLVVLLSACSNIDSNNWSGGGSRYASGVAYTPGADTADTGGEDTADTPGDENGADLQSGAAMYEENEASELFIAAGITYVDDPDDVVGGRLYYTLYADGQVAADESLDIVEGRTFDTTSQAGANDGTIVFQLGPVEAGVVHNIEAYVVDYTRNRSNTIGIDVTSP